MWNIEYKGKISGDLEQISSGKPLPEGSVMFKEPDTSGKAFALGTIFAIPLIALMLWLAICRIISTCGKPSGIKFEEFIIPFAITCLLMFLSQYVHEFIHAFLFPKNVKKEIYVSLESQMLFVYCEELVSKKRFIIAVLGPAVILGIIPYIVWYMIAPTISFPITLMMLLFAIANVACAVGDFLNTYNCVRQVPKDGKVFNRGLHSYWVQ